MNVIKLEVNGYVLELCRGIGARILTDNNVCIDCGTNYENRKRPELKIQTNAVGSLTIEEMENYLNEYQKAIESVKELEKEIDRILEKEIDFFE